jgi:hypothetical protein
VFGFDSLLKYADEHHRTVTVALLGLLVIGALGGGLLIQTLQTSITPRDQLHDQRIKSIENEYKVERANLRVRRTPLRGRTRIQARLYLLRRTGPPPRTIAI